MKRLWNVITQKENEKTWRNRETSISLVRSGLSMLEVPSDAPYAFIIAFFDYLYTNGIRLDKSLPTTEIRIHTEDSSDYFYLESYDEYCVEFRRENLLLSFRLRVDTRPRTEHLDFERYAVRSFQIYAVDKKGKIPLLQEFRRPNESIVFEKDVPESVQPYVREIITYLQEETDFAEEEFENQLLINISEKKKERENRLAYFAGKR